MNAIEQYRAGMKALGATDAEINDKIMIKANFYLERRKQQLSAKLDAAMELMTTEELLKLEGGVL